MPHGLSPQSLDKAARPSYLANDTIAALATAPGGPLSIIRISGPRAFAVANRLRGSSITETPPRKLVRSHFFTPDGAPLDDGLIVQFPGPDSFTGEDVVELHLHGSSYLAVRILELLAQEGARQALPGEFSFRAVRNGKMSVAQAQAVADMIEASNDDALTLALEKMAGSQSNLLHQVAQELRTLAALGEIGIDFADQDLDEVSLPHLKKQLAPAALTLARLKESFSRGSLLQDGIKVAFAGLPNAGKSLFFNTLLGEDRSIVSDIPGTTRDIVRERMTLRSKSQTLTLRLEDTAGLRSSDDQIEKIGVERAARAARDCHLLLYLLDSTTLLTEDFRKSLEQWQKIGSPVTKTIGILTKTDLLTPQQLLHISQTTLEFGISSWVPVSSLTGDGVSKAVETMINFCSKWVFRQNGEVLLTRIDQVQAVSATLACLERAGQASELDLFAADIRQALHAMAILIGETPADDILAQIFAKFCIGK